MNKKTIIIITVLGLGIGGYFAMNSVSNPSGMPMGEMTAHNDHQHHSNNMMDDSRESSMSQSMDTANYEESLKQYFNLQNALANDNLIAAQQAGKSLAIALGEESDVTPLAHHIHHSDSLDKVRPLFESLSKEIEALVMHHGSPNGMAIKKYHCPMVDNSRGASWLQNSEGTKNPYYGSAMPHCGSKIGTM